MVSVTDRIRQKLADRVFNNIGKTVTFKSQVTTIYNERGGVDSITYATSTVNIVPYNEKDSDIMHERFGDLRAGEMLIASPYDLTVVNGDVFTIDGTDFEVHDIHKNQLGDNVVNICRITKIQV